MVSEKFFEDLSDNEIRVADLQISEEYTYIKEIVLPKKQSILDYFKGTYIEAFEDNYRTYITRNNFFNNIQQYDYKIVLHDHVDTIVNSYIPFLLPHLKNKSITGMKFKNTKTPPVKKHS
jgi:hypothetical protein